MTHTPDQTTAKKNNREKKKAKKPCSENQHSKLVRHHQSGASLADNNLHFLNHGLELSMMNRTILLVNGLPSM